MSTDLATPADARLSTDGSASTRRAIAFELVKLTSQWRVRLAVLAAWVGPAVCILVITRQSSLPADTLFGRRMLESGWADSLVVLGFAEFLVLPLLTSLVAGDVFASEDRLGTWRHLLIAVRSPRRIFLAKAFAGYSLVLVMLAGLAISSIVGGLVAVGGHPLIGLDGHSFSGGAAAARVLTAWLSVLPATLTLASIGLLGSVLFGRSPLGLALPVVAAFGMDGMLQLPFPAIVRLALPYNSFLAWRGLFTDPAQAGPVLIGLAVNLAWILVLTALAYRLFVRRDFTDVSYDGAPGRQVLTAIAPVAGLLAAAALAIAVVGHPSGSGIDRQKLERSLASSYAQLYALQNHELQRTPITAAQTHATASCHNGSQTDRGPGNDWRCVITWQVPGSTVVGNAIYQLEVTPDGRYVADGDGPKEVNGFFQVRTPRGDAPNPLWQFDGSVELLS